MTDSNYGAINATLEHLNETVKSTVDKMERILTQVTEMNRKIDMLEWKLADIEKQQKESQVVLDQVKGLEMQLQGATKLIKVQWVIGAFIGSVIWYVYTHAVELFGK